MKKREIFFLGVHVILSLLLKGLAYFLNTFSVYGHISLNLFLGVSFIFDLIFCFVAAMYFYCWP